jgi:hypothetical protein
MYSAFLFMLLVVFSGFNCLLSINFFEKEDQRRLYGSSFGFKASVFLLFKFGNFSKISRVVFVFVTIATPHKGTLRFLIILAYNTGKRFKYAFYLLVVKQDLDHWCA